jgi:hypothetical protein
MEGLKSASMASVCSLDVPLSDVFLNWTVENASTGGNGATGRGGGDLDIRGKGE